MSLNPDDSDQGKNKYVHSLRSTGNMTHILDVGKLVKQLCVFPKTSPHDWQGFLSTAISPYMSLGHFLQWLPLLA